MELRLKQVQCLAQHTGLMKISATLQAPVIKLLNWNDVMPTLTIEEGGIEIALEFVNDAALRRFQQRLSTLTTSEE